MRTVAIWTLFSLFTIVALGQHYRYKKYCRFDSLVHAAVFYGSGIFGLFSKSFIPFLGGFVITGVMSCVIAYWRRRQASPSAADLAKRLFDDTKSTRDAKRQIVVLSDAFNDPDNASVIKEFDLSGADFTSAFDAMLRVGCPCSEAELAMHEPKILGWYFSNVGRQGVFTMVTRIEFVLMVREYAAREG